VSREARRCVVLWRCYLAAELHYGRPQAARRVFLRAIHECPGSQVHRSNHNPRRPRRFIVSNLCADLWGAGGEIRRPTLGSTCESIEAVR